VYKTHQRFSDKFRSHWIKVKFYEHKPDLNKAKKLKGVRFCEATKQAISGPVLLDKDSINCSGAQYAFGWSDFGKDEGVFFNSCQDKRKANKVILNSLFTHAPRFKESFSYIGLNTEGEPDLIMSYLSPEEAMNLVKIYNNHQGGSLDVSLSSMMPICAGIAVRTYREKRISFSFGCDDSRKFAQIGRDRLAVGVPWKLSNDFMVKKGDE